MVGFIMILSIIVGILFITLVISQGKENEGILEAFSGNQELKLFSNVEERGNEKILKRITNILGVIFVVLILILVFVQKV